MDRDGKFCPAFRTILKDEDVTPVLLPPKSPNLNAHLERFHRSLKEDSTAGQIKCRERLGGILRYYDAGREGGHLAAGRWIA